ncbi:MAG TPA: ChaN family lipoprotein [Desulfuromonadales bacterium]|jgi:uncharacterized iron-regulated protein
MSKPAMTLLSALVLACSIHLHAASAHAHTLRLADGTYVGFAELIEELKRVRLVFMGEMHDNEGHHRAQLQVIRALKEAGVQVVVGLEMIRRENQTTLDLWVAGKMSEENFLKVFRQNWSMWPVYRDIFHYARQEKVPLLGLNLSREITQQVARNGFASLSPRQLGELPAVRCDVDARYQDFIRRSLGGHAHNGAQFLHFCEAQMLWDSVMAQTLLDYLARHPDAVIVVLAGSGHAWKHGIPEQIRRRSADKMRILLPAVPGRIDQDNITLNEADYLLLGVEEGPLH